MKTKKNKQKLIVVTTNLAMRFYSSDGWTLKKLLTLVTKTNDYEEPFHYWDKDVITYWIPKVGTRLDLDKLMKLDIVVQRTFNDYPGEEDRKFLERYNW